MPGTIPPDSDRAVWSGGPLPSDLSADERLACEMAAFTASGGGGRWLPRHREELRMRRIVAALVGVVAVVGVIDATGHLSGIDGEAAREDARSWPRAVAHAQDALASKLTRREVQRAPSSIPGREIVQVETLIPPGVESGWHTHPGEEVGFIIVGEVEMKVQGRATVVLRPGEGFLIPPGVPHNARDLGPETGRMLSTYIVEAGRPIATLVDPPAQR